MVNIDALHDFLAERGREHLLDAGLLAAHENGTLDEFLAERGAQHLPDAGLAVLLSNNVCGFELDDGTVAYYIV